MSEEQKKEYEQQQKMGRVIIKNETPSTVYLVVDYTDHGNIPSGKRAFVTVPAGGHTLEAYGRNGHLVARVSIWLCESERYHWDIGG
jgi:hypothetical protein